MRIFAVADKTLLKQTTGESAKKAGADRSVDTGIFTRRPWSAALLAIGESV
jgi:hypothetical protein